MDFQKHSPGVVNLPVSRLKRVLVIDDDPQICELLVMILDRTYDVQVAGNGQNGIAAALRDLPDIILCDFSMPTMTGAEVVEQLRTNRATERIPVLLMSGRGEVSSTSEPHIPLEFLQKPFHFGEVLDAIAKALARGQ